MNVLITIIGIAALLLFWVILFDSNRFVVKRHTVTDGRIKKDFRAVVLSDLHNKQYGKNNEALLAAIRSQKPDIVLIAGDILTAKKNASMEPAVVLLRELAREYPVYYGNGNHEHRLKLYPKIYGDMADRYAEALREMGIEPLVNSHVSLPEYGVSIYGSEIHERYFKRFRREKMGEGYLPGLLGRTDQNMYTVLLAHDPDYFPRYASWGADLVLSGHVHGGVARVPFWGRGVISPALLPFPKYDGGIFRQGNATMVLSRGLGTHTIPIRVFNPAELWVVEFRAETKVLS